MKKKEEEETRYRKKKKTNRGKDADPCKFSFIKSKMLFDYLYSTPTVDEFFDGIEATLPSKAFNSPIALPGFKPYRKKR
jgi:hypothetical protein